jgi:hypothetical protein
MQTPTRGKEEFKVNRNIDLKSTEQASYKLAAHADGLADITLGLVFILLGFYPLTRGAFGPTGNMFFVLAVLGLITFAQARIKKRVSAERIGLVSFGPQVQKRKKVALLITVLLAAGMIATWVLSARGWFPGTPRWLGSYGFEIIVALIVLGIFWAVAYSLDLRRYYFYGVLLGAGFPLQSLLDGKFEGAPFLAAGLIITGIGVFLLNRFLKAFPEAPREVANG